MKSGSNIFMVLAVRFCTAMRFLTLLPISWRAEEDSQHFAKCLMFFAVVGLVIGGIGTCGVFFLSKGFPQPVVIAVGIAYLAFISGCLHLDGLSDSADGLLSSRPKEACLQIMKDSRAGAMGIVVVVLVLLIKYAALSAMPMETLMLAFFLMPLAGRSAILLTMANLPYARIEGGLGSLFYTGNSKKAAAVGLALLFVCLLFLATDQLLPILIGFFLITYLFNRWCKVKLGGATGDTLGAVCELTEMIVAVSLTATFPPFFQ
ncbi:MAG: adenosylcobinamide-GDP ribazoletransferase [Proteobacteria bacterium]|nr:adenosylcobinamide-GDP ribazoletransferase [Pseudomonadota bacterium]